MFITDEGNKVKCLKLPTITGVVMSLNMSSFIKSLLPSFDKSEVESDLELSLDSITQIVEAYVSLGEALKVFRFSSKVNKDLIKEIYKELKGTKHKVKLSSNEDIAADTILLFGNIKTNGEYILKELSDSLNDVVVSGALTAYKAVLLRSVSDYYFLTRYAIDLINYLYVLEAEGPGWNPSREYGLNKKQREFVSKNAWIYARLLAVYGDDTTAFKERIANVGDIMLPREEVDKALDSYDSSKVDIINNIPSGFLGSPFYTVRLIFAQWEADRYKGLKDKRRLLELRCLHLTLMKEQNQTDVKLEKEIIYLQQQLTTLDYKLARIEESVDD